LVDILSQWLNFAPAFKHTPDITKFTMSDDEYDINDPRTREHNAYKIAQDNYGRAVRRYKYGDDVDDDDSRESSPDEGENHDSLETKLANAREARAWAIESVSVLVIKR
jgi:hypothetical protein